jgi:hypothetical protein
MLRRARKGLLENRQRRRVDAYPNACPNFGNPRGGTVKVISRDRTYFVKEKGDETNSVVSGDDGAGARFDGHYGSSRDYADHRRAVPGERRRALK